MSYYFAIVGTSDDPLFEHECGTSKSGGDGIARFREEARHMNQFIVHASLDIVDEVQWNGGAMYLKLVDRYHNNYISCFITGASVKFMLLYNPDANAGGGKSSAVNARQGAYGQPSTTYNPSAPAVEEAIKNFYVEVYDAWVKTAMNPFYKREARVTSPVFRTKVATAARKYL